MLNLVMKDFFIQKNNFKNYVLIGLFFGFIFTLNGMGCMTLAVATFPIIFGFISRAAYEDEANHAIRWIATLPIKKANVVKARYLSVAIACILTILVFELIYNILLFQSFITIEGSTESVLPFFIVILIFMVSISFYMPMIYELGYIKAANIYRFVMFGFIAVGVVIGKFASSFGPPPVVILNLINWIGQMGELQLSIGILGVSIVIYYTSMIVSISIHKRKNYFNN